WPSLCRGPSRRQIGDVAQRMFVGGGALDRASEQLAAEIRHRTYHFGPSRMSETGAENPS
ncbi:MAG TPA: hypothetical protein VIU87_13570, partial [Mycobacterium sp.]